MLKNNHFAFIYFIYNQLTLVPDFYTKKMAQASSLCHCVFKVY
ncbi:hypothetical protein F543_1800 [Bibersteinia trehalosi USDA-ARS-USMARC-189]|uniref:Uncharacterized protein n=1 Tax=Bibersteinia trehalosi USDA-ARS-USMARC-189 TaxID=1263831 RepID=A0ABM5PBP5_BIBTR|nr:hypothetical protein F543_1800 [Bibersteinia trehalosi USDA-ARS-USMARC-189]